MANVKWIKIVTDIFDDEKMLMIESLPSADSIMIVWFKLLCLAGKTNNSGVFIFNDKIPYTDEMLSSIFRRDINTVRMALKTFEAFGMVEIVDNVITLPNWSKHQTLDAYERQKERERLKKQKKRAEQRALISAKSGDTSGDTSGECHGDVPPVEREGEKEKEEDKEKDIIEDTTADKPPTAPAFRVPYESIKDLYNQICVSFPRCTTLSESRKKAISARFKGGYKVADFETLFRKAEASSFLKGANDRNWAATFDWLLEDANMPKVLDGNYDDNKGANSNGTTTGDAGQRKRYGTYL